MPTFRSHVEYHVTQRDFPLEEVALVIEPDKIERDEEESAV